VLAVKPVKTGHVIAIDLPAKRKDVARYGAEDDVMDVDASLNRARLDRTFEISGDSVAVLRDLDVFHDRFAVLNVCGVNRPVTLDVVRWLLGQHGFAKDQRREHQASESQRRVHTLHDILLFACDLFAACVACEKSTANR